MKDWENLEYSSTYRELVDKFNVNSNNSKFIDSITGKILNNGILFSGLETIDGNTILPLVNAKPNNDLVNSDTIFDNFILYFRAINKFVELNLFPIDLLSYADGKLHFIFIKADRTYRISSSMFGRVDEIILGRFVISENSTWNQFYMMGQRCGTPMYDAADEFYNVEGMYVKSPENLSLSMESGSVKRSGIQFTDLNSPDIIDFHNLSSQSMPIRYVNERNEIDYSVSPVNSIITNKYMVYNMNKKLKTKIEKYIDDISNMTYNLQDLALSYSDTLLQAIEDGATESEKQQIIEDFLYYITNIYEVSDNIYEVLGDPSLSSISRIELYGNKSDIEAYINTNLRNIVSISSSQVNAIKDVVSYVLLLNTEICNNPLMIILNTIADELDDIDYSVGTIGDVPAGKFTLQRILWDIYDNSLVVQYGDTIYDTSSDATNASALIAYPAPWDNIIYIPLAVIVLKSGITSINDDGDTVIISRRWIYVDQEQEGYVDYYARAKALQAITIAAQLQAEMLQLRADITAQLNAFKTTIEGEMSALRSDLENRMSTLETSLNNKINNISNKVAVYGDFVTSRHEKDLGNMGGLYGGENTLSVSKSGYMPLGIVGVTISQNVRPGSGFYNYDIKGFRLSTRNSGSATIWWQYMFDYQGGGVMNVKAQFDILWVKIKS